MLRIRNKDRISLALLSSHTQNINHLLPQTDEDHQNFGQVIQVAGIREATVEKPVGDKGEIAKTIL